MTFKIHYRTDVGLRSNNEDSYWALRYQGRTHQGTATEGAIIAVCDGMGGLSGGEKASSETIRCLRDALITGKDFSNESIIAAIKEANTRLINFGLKQAEKFKAENPGQAIPKRRLMLGTTCTLLVLENNSYRVFHVGDSRCYQVFNDNSYTALTKDHTAFEKYKHEIKRIDQNQFILHGKVQSAKSISKLASSLTNSVGTKQNIDIDVVTGTYQSGDMFLISSDGFWHELVSARSTTHKEWVPLLKQDTDKALIDLMEQFKARGERDNLTATVVKVL